MTGKPKQVALDHTHRVDRRTVLRGAGAALSLPFLEAMRPNVAAAAESDRPVRSAFIFFPNGAIMPQWTPSRYGSRYELSGTLSSLEPHKNDLLVASGLAQDLARAHGDGGGDHARNASTFLTCAHPRKTNGADIQVGKSIDQEIASVVGEQTRLPSLELGLTPSQHSGRCDSGYSCAYTSNISWRSPSMPTSKEIHPRLVFERMFGGEQESPEARKRRLYFRKSILDFVADDTAKLEKKLGGEDRNKLAEYLASVREVEQRIELASRNSEAVAVPTDVNIPRAMPKDYGERMRLMYDLIALAFRTDTTRVCTFMLSNGGSNWSFPDLDVREGHHQLSHHRNDQAKIDKIARIDRFVTEQFAYFVKKLKDTSDGDGSLIDSSMVVFGSSISDGNRHQHHDLPVVVAGRGNGLIKTGRHLNWGHEVKGKDRGSAALKNLGNKEETPLANLYLSMLHKHGGNAVRFGDSTGELKALS